MFVAPANHSENHYPQIEKTWNSGESTRITLKAQRRLIQEVTAEFWPKITENLVSLLLKNILKIPKSKKILCGLTGQKLNILESVLSVTSGVKGAQHFLKSNVMPTVKHGGALLDLLVSGPGQFAVIDGTTKSTLYQKIMKENVRPSDNALSALWFCYKTMIQNVPASPHTNGFKETKWRFWSGRVKVKVALEWTWIWLRCCGMILKRQLMLENPQMIADCSIVVVAAKGGTTITYSNVINMQK